MKRKVGFWRWLFEGLVHLPKNLSEGLIEGVRNPVGEMALGLGVAFFGVVLMRILYEIPTVFAPIYLGILFPLATLLILHGIYRDEVE